LGWGSGRRCLSEGFGGFGGFGQLFQPGTAGIAGVQSPGGGPGWGEVGRHLPDPPWEPGSASRLPSIPGPTRQIREARLWQDEICPKKNHLGGDFSQQKDAFLGEKTPRMGAADF